MTSTVQAEMSAYPARLRTGHKLPKIPKLDLANTGKPGHNLQSSLWDRTDIPTNVIDSTGSGAHGNEEAGDRIANPNAEPCLPP